jgi:hypothetical protein
MDREAEEINYLIWFDIWFDLVRCYWYGTGTGTLLSFGIGKMLTNSVYFYGTCRMEISGIVFICVKATEEHF